MSITYTELRDRQQEEVNNFPFFFAFNDAQFDEGMRKHGLNPNKKSDIAKICSIGAGGYLKKEDVPAMHEMFARHHTELIDMISQDVTGEGFIFDMFCTELFNHEYGLTGNVEPARTALGLTIEEVNASLALTNGLKLAAAYVSEHTY